MSITLALLHAFFVVKQCNGKTFLCVSLACCNSTYEITGQHFAAVCCLELKINSSLQTFKRSSHYNTYNASEADLSGLYRSTHSLRSKGMSH